MATEFQSVTPYLCCSGAEKALAFYIEAFDAKEVFRMTDPGDGRRASGVPHRRGAVIPRGRVPGLWRGESRHAGRHAGVAAPAGQRLRRGGRAGGGSRGDGVAPTCGPKLWRAHGADPGPLGAQVVHCPDGRTGESRRDAAPLGGGDRDLGARWRFGGAGCDGPGGCSVAIRGIFGCAVLMVWAYRGVVPGGRAGYLAGLWLPAGGVAGRVGDTIALSRGLGRAEWRFRPRRTGYVIVSGRVASCTPRCFRFRQVAWLVAAG